MKIVNLTGSDLLYKVQSNNKYSNDYYRNFYEYDKDNILALYYKEINPKELRNYKETWINYNKILR